MTVCGAVDIGGTKIRLGIVEEGGRILAVRLLETRTGQGGAARNLQEIAEGIRSLCGEAGVEYETLAGIGIVCTGPVNCEEGIIENPYTLPGWERLPLCRRLQELTGLEVFLEHDVNGALLGEIEQRGLENQRVLMACFGTGIGIAVYDYDNRLYRAGRKYHPELGHMVIDAGENTQCYCGQSGCFESLWSGGALRERARAAGYDDFGAMYRAWLQGEEQARAAFGLLSRWFQQGMWNLLLAFKPDIVILGGGVMEDYYIFAADLLRKMAEGKEDFLEKFTILPAGKAGSSALIGASVLVFS